MDVKSQDRVLSSLNMAIEALNLAKEISSITPAKTAFGSVSALLAIIRVRFLLLRDDKPWVHIYYPGLDGQQSRLRRAWTGLRRRM